MASISQKFFRGIEVILFYYTRKCFQMRVLTGYGNFFHRMILAQYVYGLSIGAQRMVYNTSCSKKIERFLGTNP